MISITISRLLPILLACAVGAGEARAQLSPTAEVVYLRKDCTGVANCSTDLVALTNWIFSTRHPSASSPLLMDIGPGDFQGPFLCKNGNGWVTLRGSGRGQTRILSAPVGVMDFLESAVDIQLPGGCTNLEFQDMTLQGKRLGVYWQGAGVSTWTNVDIVGGSVPRSFVEGAGIGWWDGGQIGCGGETPPADIPLHYFYNSNVRGLGGPMNIGFVVHCGEHWFFGGEITAIPEDPVSEGVLMNVGVQVQSWGRFHAFGTAIRARAGAATSTSYAAPITGVEVQDKGMFHMHGGIIRADAVQAPWTAISVIGIDVKPGALQVHTPDTSFVVQSALGGSARRLAGSGPAVQSPFLWPPSTLPPASASLVEPEVQSVHASDLYVESDCQESGACDAGGGSEPHLMVYSESCSPSPWFDTVTGRCRNVTGP